jgi:hypothetical protein
MATNTPHEPENDGLPRASEGEASPFGLEAEEVEVIALRLWRRASCLETIGDECCFCQGEAQRCLAICQ